jgi:hypothetical protein
LHNGFLWVLPEAAQGFFEQGTSITLNDWQNLGKWHQAAILMFKNTVTNAI